MLFRYLAQLDCSEVTVHSVKEGSVVFPKTPVMTLSGPLAVCQLLESTLLNMCGYASLLATNAARMRLAVGPSTQLLEFGLRRAQGTNGAMSAAKYAYIGGFDSTSNVSGLWDVVCLLRWFLVSGEKLKKEGLSVSRFINAKHSVVVIVK